MAPFDSDSKCCGFGGHMQLVDPELYQCICQNRSSENEYSYVLYCANCRDIFTKAGKRCAHILDLLFDLGTTGAATLQEKRRNGLSLKKELMHKYRKMSLEMSHPAGGGLLIEYTPEAANKMETQLIAPEDVEEAIRSGENDANGFVGGQGSFLSSYSGPATTCWVCYRVEQSGMQTRYKVDDVYSHRMRVRGLKA